MGFTKLDERILRSSIMSESPEVFKVWIALLAACEEDGIAELSATYLARVCYLDADIVIEALDRLSEPDKLSRSTEHDGRRIERVDGGYKILNYHTYRQHSLRGAEAERKRLYRAEKKAEAGAVRTKPDASRACPDASASSSASSFSFSFLNWWQRYPRKLGKRDAAKAYEIALRDGASPHDLDISLTHYIQELRRLGTDEKYIKHPATFLRAERWKDYLEMPEVKGQEKVGEAGRGETKAAEYWEEVRRLKALGLQGEELTKKIKEWEEKHGQGKN